MVLSFFKGYYVFIVFRANCMHNRKALLRKLVIHIGISLMYGKINKGALRGKEHTICVLY